MTPSHLNQAGERLDRAAAEFSEIASRPADETTFGQAEREWEDARTEFRIALSQLTGIDPETLERRLSA